jgi:lipid-binding SYLF domain-containing protein
MTRPISAIITVVLMCCMSAAMANKLEKRVENATEVIQRFTQIPERGIPPSLLNNAYAVAVIPSVVKAGFVLGGSYGRGILVTRLDDGRWSNPAFITLGAGSVGFQAGAQSTDVVLVFKTHKSVDRIHNGRLTLGGDMAIATGPVGRSTSAATDFRLRAEIYSYSRSRGLFGGISLEGAVLAMDQKANFAYYGSGESTARNLLSDSALPTPATARRFQETLAATAPQLAWLPQSGARTAEAEIDPAAPVPEEERSGAQVFGIDEAPTAEQRGDIF